MQWYRTGTITVTNGSATVTGASTLWSDVGTLNPGDILNAPDGKLYEILTINSNTGITLNSVYLGTSLSAQAYSIMPIGLLPSTLAQSVKTTLATANTALASTVRYDINSMGLSLTQQQNARTNIAALSALDVGQGRLSKSVAGGVDVTLTAVEASNQFIELTGTITANINVIVPAAARLFYVYNSTSGAFTVTVKTPSGVGIAIATGDRLMLECDATNIVNPTLGKGAFVGSATGATSQVLSLTNTGAGGSTKAQIGFYAAGSRYAGMAGGYGASAPEISWDIQGTDYLKLTATGLAVTGALSATNNAQLTVASGNIGYGLLSGTTNYSLYVNAADNSLRIYGSTGTAGDKLVLDSSGNLGLGVVPSAWVYSGKVIELLDNSAICTAGPNISIGSNKYWNGSNWIYKTSAPVALYVQASGVHSWGYAPSGTAGTVVSSTQVMTLDASGNLLLAVSSAGTTNQSGAFISPAYSFTNAAGMWLGHASGTGTGAVYHGFGYNGTIIGSITQNGTTAVLYNTTSDYRLKTDVSTIPGTEALARLAAVRPVDFTWISDGSKDAGFIAHEFQATYSRNVTGEKDGTEQQEYEVTPAVPATETTEAVPAVMGTRTVPKYQQMDNSAAVPDLVAAVTYLAQQHATIAADFAAYKTAHP